MFNVAVNYLPCNETTIGYIALPNWIRRNMFYHHSFCIYLSTYRTKIVKIETLVQEALNEDLHPLPLQQASSFPNGQFL